MKKNLTFAELEQYSYALLMTEISVYLYVRNEEQGKPLFESMVNLSVISKGIADEYRKKYKDGLWEESNLYDELFELCDNYINSIRLSNFEIEVISTERYKRTYTIKASDPKDAERLFLEDKTNATVLDVEYQGEISKEIEVK
jgi:hypothetical protein